MIEPVKNSDMVYPQPNLSYVNKVKANNLKPGKGNLHVQVVRNALSRVYPALVNPGGEYDDVMEQAVRKLQYDLGQPQTGHITKDELIALSNIEGSDFSVV